MITVKIPDDEYEAVLERIRNAPVHRLENVDGDPYRVRTMCRKYGYAIMRVAVPLDPDRADVYPVTCPECLALITDIPTIVE